MLSAVLGVSTVSREIRIPNRVVGDCAEPTSLLGLAQNVTLAPFRDLLGKKRSSWPLRIAITGNGSQQPGTTPLQDWDQPGGKLSLRFCDDSYPEAERVPLDVAASCFKETTPRYSPCLPIGFATGDLSYACLRRSISACSIVGSSHHCRRKRSGALSSRTSRPRSVAGLCSQPSPEVPAAANLNPLAIHVPGSQCHSLLRAQNSHGIRPERWQGFGSTGSLIVRPETISAHEDPEAPLSDVGHCNSEKVARGQAKRSMGFPNDRDEVELSSSREELMAEVATRETA